MKKQTNPLNSVLNKIEQNDAILSTIQLLLTEKVTFRDELKNQLKAILKDVLLSNEKNTDYLNLSSADFPALLLGTSYENVTVKSYLERQIDFLIKDNKVGLILPRKGWEKFWLTIPKETRTYLRITNQSLPCHFKRTFTKEEVPVDEYVYLEMDLIWY